jgi:hypothetical protein
LIANCTKPVEAIRSFKIDVSRSMSLAGHVPDAALVSAHGAEADIRSGAAPFA